MKIGHVGVSEHHLDALCHRWQVQELADFGSVLRDDFGPNSDVDLLVTFTPGVPGLSSTSSPSATTSLVSSAAPST